MKAKARRTDPQSSHDAARNVESSGKATKHRDMIIAALKEHGPGTAHEIAKDAGLNNVEVSRKMSELERESFVVRDHTLAICSITGKKLTQWMIPLGSVPIPCKKKKPQGLRCWACRDDDGTMGFYACDQPQKVAGVYLCCNDKDSGCGCCRDNPTCIVFEWDKFANAIFPPSIKPGECVEVVIPMAVILEDD